MQYKIATIVMTIEKEIKSTIPLEISKKVILNIFFTRNVVVDNLLELLKPFDISIEQYNVLRILKGQKGIPANMNVIQERMITKNSNTTRLIDKLLNKQKVTRAVCPSNKRKIEINITQKGLDTLDSLEPNIYNLESFFTNKLNSNELEQLNSLLEKLRT